MTDDEWKDRVSRIQCPYELLKWIVDNERFFGYDSYYSDLRKSMLVQASKLVSEKDEQYQGLGDYTY